MARVVQTPRAPAVTTDEEHDATRPSGFDGRVWCSSLADLVQLECLSGARAVISVVSAGRRGTLFFDAGSVCHASVGDSSQEDAALEILSWEWGTFEQALVEQAQTGLPWPERVPIAASWQQLVMCAAQRRDEAGPRDAAAPPTSLVRPLPPHRGTRAASVQPLPTPRLGPPSLAAVPPSARAPAPPEHASRLEYDRAVLLGAQDQVLAARGTELSGLAVYLRRLTALIATDLGAAGATGLACLDGKATLLLFSGADERCVALESTGTLTPQRAAQCLMEPATLQAVAAALAEEDYGNGVEL